MIPQEVKDLILEYYSKLGLIVSSGLLTSDWHQLEVGVITRCTILVTLFALPMNMLFKSTCRGPLSKSGVWTTYSIQALMDDSL